MRSDAGTALRETPHVAGIGAIDRFLFAPASPLPLAGLRVGVAAVLLLQAIALRAELFDLYGSAGILQDGLGETPGEIGMGSWLALTWRMGIPEPAAISALAVGYVLALVALLVGLRTRVAGALACLGHALLTGGQITTYGLDIFAQVMLFLLPWTPSGEALSLDARGTAPRASSAARLSLRVIQMYLCIAYLASGLEKIVGPQWRDGDAIWRTLMLPTFAQYDMAWIARYPWMARLGAWYTLVVETGYCVFIWPRRTRTLWIAATVALHAGIALFMGLTLFGLIMIVLTVCAFGISAEPRAPTGVPSAQAP